MDHRDWPLWIAEAEKEYARLERRMADAAAYPNMEENSRRHYMQNLVNKINGIRPEDMLDPTPEMEAEWARNRAELAAIVGRKK